MAMDRILACRQHILRLKQLSSGLYFSYQTHNMVNVKHLNMQTKHAPVYSKLVKDQWLYALDVYQSSCPQADYNVKCPLYFTKRNYNQEV